MRLGVAWGKNGRFQSEFCIQDSDGGAGSHGLSEGGYNRPKQPGRLGEASLVCPAWA